MAKTEYNKDKLVILPIDSIKANKWNPKNKDTKEYKQVVRSLELHGFRQPILVRESDDGKYEILDGEQRYTAAKELAYTDVPVYNLGKISDTEAKAATIWMEVQVPFNEIDLSHLVVELDSLDVALPYSEVEIEDFKNMAQFNFDDLGDGEPQDGLDDIKTFKVVLGAEAHKIVTKAIDKIKEDNDCGEARALELLCADYLAGV